MTSVFSQVLANHSQSFLSPFMAAIAKIHLQFLFFYEGINHKTHFFFEIDFNKKISP